MFKPKMAIFDLDGVLVEIGERFRFFTRPDGQQWTHGDGSGWEPDHASFNASAATAPVIAPMVLLNQALVAAGWKIAIVTGRDEESRAMTAVHAHVNGILYDFLQMRATTDKRPDAEYKEAQLLKLQKLYDVQLAFEDRDSVVAMYRSHNIICNQTNKALY